MADISTYYSIPYHNDVLRRYHAFPSNCLRGKSIERKAPLMKIDARSYIKHYYTYYIVYNAMHYTETSQLPLTVRVNTCEVRVKQAQLGSSQLATLRFLYVCV